jgi:radical SAM superfamily enzyme YgiQ (UPF0313 family)
MALFAGITRFHDYDYYGFDLNTDLYNAVSNDDKELWNGEDAYKWVTKSEEIFHKYHDYLNSYIKKIVNLDISVFAIYTQGVSKQMSFMLADKIKRIHSEANIILGGPQCFPAYDGLDIFKDNPNVDAICTGEADLVWPVVLEHFSKYGNFHVDIDGIAYRLEDGSVRGGQVPAMVNDLDRVPFADYSGIDFSKHNSVDYRIPIMASRGCINTCAFCNEKPNFFKYRSRSAQNIFDEIKKHLAVIHGDAPGTGAREYYFRKQISAVLKKIYSLSRKFEFLTKSRVAIKQFLNTKNFQVVRNSAYPPYIAFNDSLINGKPKELLKFCNLVMESGIKFNWGGMALIRKEMTLDLLRKMKQAGCHNLSWGLESGSEDVIKLMQKRLYTMEMAKEVIRNTSEAGINQSCSMIVGFPGETDEMFEKTVQFIKEFGSYFDYIGVQPMMIVKNSTVYDQYEQFGLDCENSRICLEWETKDGSIDYQKRLNRVKVLEDLLKEKIIKTDHE